MSKIKLTLTEADGNSLQSTLNTDGSFTGNMPDPAGCEDANDDDVNAMDETTCEETPCNEWNDDRCFEVTWTLSADANTNTNTDDDDACSTIHGTYSSVSLWEYDNDDCSGAPSNMTASDDNDLSITLNLDGSVELVQIRPMGCRGLGFGNVLDFDDDCSINIDEDDVTEAECIAYAEANPDYNIYFVAGEEITSTGTWGLKIDDDGMTVVVFKFEGEDAPGLPPLEYINGNLVYTDAVSEDEDDSNCECYYGDSDESNGDIDKPEECAEANECMEWRCEDDCSQIVIEHAD